MPYIPPEQRLDIDSGIFAVASEIRARAGEGEPWNGVLYVTLYKLARALLPELRYRSLARMTGVLENIKQEFCRRLDLPYNCVARPGWPCPCPPIEGLVAAIRKTVGDGDWEGIANYSLSSLVLAVIPARKEPYLSEAVGILEAVKQDFYRSVEGPYEDTAIAKNGDIY